MAQIVLLGANVGTAVTAWIFATGVAWLSPLLILSGIVLRKGNSNARQGGGTAWSVSADAALAASSEQRHEPMRASPALGAFIGLLDDAWPVCAASVGSHGLLLLFQPCDGRADPVAGFGRHSVHGLIIVLVLGANLGGAIPPVIATMTALPPRGASRSAISLSVPSAAPSPCRLPPMARSRCNNCACRKACCRWMRI